MDLNETIQRRTRGFQQQLEILEDPPRLAGEGAGGLWDELERDPTCRCVILTGGGQRTFTVGADISDDLSAGTEVARVVKHALAERLFEIDCRRGQRRLHRWRLRAASVHRYSCRSARGAVWPARSRRSIRSAAGYRADTVENRGALRVW